MTTILLGWCRTRENPYALANNLATYAGFPLVAGVVFHAIIRQTHFNDHEISFYLLVFVTFFVGLTVNFLGTGGYQCWLARASLLTRLRAMLLPILASELFSALLAMGTVYVAARLGTISLAMLGLVLIIFQYLTGELLTSKQRSEKLQRIATTDDLTGLANRERFREVVEERIAAARDGSSSFTVMLMDLDRFKEINDTLGHHYGDVLLRDLGPRLVTAVGEDGMVARLGGDEFAILPPPGTVDPADIENEVQRLMECISEPFSVDELSLEVGASIGVARFPHDGEDSHALLRCADIAMYAAKEAQTDYKIYTAEQNQHTVRRLSVLSDIRHALSSDEIVVHFQPIVDLDDLSVTGAEGLVRWQHPEHGLIPPGAFVQTVEQTGLIGPLTRHVLERSIAECAAWRRNGRDLSVAVNLSVRNLLDRDLPKEIERLLDSYGLPADALQLEITESMIMSDPDRAVATVTRLSALGVRMSVDDFGTGYSSLANLRKLPIDELKIDRSFVSPMLRDESDLIIVRSTINLGHDLGLRIIAEGVEDGATLQRLALLGCDHAQGYHLSRPLPARDFGAWLETASPESLSGDAAPSAPTHNPNPSRVERPSLILPGMLTP
ncbi:MAG TPA: EAL domain-containing protein [Solirubrobacteraceae bacterium]|nr:EAL domain-containing protein [Solirubrobacteraceae bacterium]